MQTIGERLEEARKKKGISIREAAEATKIRGDYLQKFEGNHFDIGLSEIYVRGFLRTYSNFLKLPADRILGDYAALGRGDARPKPPARESYGQTHIPSVSPEAGERGATPPVVTPETSSSASRPPRPRAPNALPSGPDPAVVFKYVKIGGAVVIGLLVLLILKSIFSGGGSPAAGSGSPGISAARGPTFGLVALKPTQVTVRKKTATGTEGEVLFSDLVSPGETKFVQRSGAVFIEANAPENLLIEINGKRFPMGLPAGERRGELPAP